MKIDSEKEAEKRIHLMSMIGLQGKQLHDLIKEYEQEYGEKPIIPVLNKPISELE